MKHETLQIIAKNSPHLSWIKDNTNFLVVYGSHAYGLNTPESDLDVRGFCIPPKKYYLSCFQRFEQAELKDPNPDTTIYEIRKFFNLAGQCNPNALEVLFVNSSEYLFIDEIGEEVIANRDKFLSKRAKFTTQGYAFAQLHKIKLHRKYLLNPPKQYPTRKALGLPEQTLIPADQLAAVNAAIKKELDKYNFDFFENLDESTKIEIREAWGTMLTQLKISGEDQWLSAARTIGLNDNLIEVMKKERSYASSKKEWDQYQIWKKNSNPKRALLEEKFGLDVKHASHLVRLMREGKEILTTGQVIVKRPDREELIAIKNGAWSYEKIIEYAEKMQKEMDELYEKCTILPKTTDTVYLDKLCMKLIEKSLSKYSWYSVKKILRNKFDL